MNGSVAARQLRVSSCRGLMPFTALALAAILLQNILLWRMCNGSMPVPREPEKMRKAGEVEYMKIATLASEDQKMATDASCWRSALSFFHNLTESCNIMDDSTKSLIALTLTKCHYAVRPSGFPTGPSGCEPTAPHVTAACIVEDSRDGDPPHDATSNPTDFLEAKKRAIADCQRRRIEMVVTCKTLLSEPAFAVFIQFLNHVDNICFYIQSTLWQERTEDTILRLSSTASDVVHQLDQAKQTQLTIAQEAQTEREKMKSFFDEIFSLIYRMQSFQRVLSSQLSDFGTSLTYVVLVVVTYYLTGTKATNRCRLSVYLVWTLMLTVEVATHRLVSYARTSHPSFIDSAFDSSSLSSLRGILFGDVFSSDPSSQGEDADFVPASRTAALCRFVGNSVARLVRWMAIYLILIIQHRVTDDTVASFLSCWRLFCMLWAAFIYLRAWWSYTDPYVATLRAVEEMRIGLEDVKKLAVAAHGQQSTPDDIQAATRSGRLFAPFLSIFGSNRAANMYDDNALQQDDDSDHDPDYDPCKEGCSDFYIPEGNLHLPPHLRQYARSGPYNNQVPTSLSSSCTYNPFHVRGMMTAGPVDRRITPAGARRLSLPMPPRGVASKPAESSSLKSAANDTAAGCGARRRNPHRAARPLSLRLPRTLEEMSTAPPFNQVLLHETPQMFERELEYRRLQTTLERMANFGVTEGGGRVPGDDAQKDSECDDGADAYDDYYHGSSSGSGSGSSRGSTDDSGSSEYDDCSDDEYSNGSLYGEPHAAQFPKSAKDAAGARQPHPSSNCRSTTPYSRPQQFSGTKVGSNLSTPAAAAGEARGPRRGPVHATAAAAPVGSSPGRKGRSSAAHSTDAPLSATRRRVTQRT